MAQLDNRYATSGYSAQNRAGVDEGLRSYMLGVYNYMAAGVALTGIAAYLTYSLALSGGQLTPFGQALYTSPLKWVVMLAPLAFVFFLSFRVEKMSVGAAQVTFWLFAAVMGVSLSSIFMVFTGQSITQIFFITAATFGALSLWGYTTKRDISGWGSFLFMGLIGIILASIVNIFLQSSALQFAVSAIGVLVFAGLTAYDTQRIKDTYFQVAGNAELAAKSAIMGALSLYLDFINMFMMLLNLFGNRE
ncbi:Bax inhibitor-1/YccA family protein [Hyphomicrobium sp. D-2]|uniref:Bax inhibitor-1/YccA family protein n=1 Tax=Hyphomicrobium sp. D-2 TaxID=3041621 RepID=UPI002456AABC|nr:Bax inhibitor-1/YccA family protein [Hyphomicrobium sp. D-2]MDH4983375.1 Bax inhibitor-1/YccA family protein [Hyphomicrobium sp. D-2]